MKLMEKLWWSHGGHSPSEMVSKLYSCIVVSILVLVYISWYYTSNILSIARPSNEYESTRLLLRQNMEYILDREKQLVVKSSMEQMVENDGFSAWRKEEADDLSRTVQEAIARLQAPADCKTAKKLVCPLTYSCGLGCQLHIAAYCLITALATGRVLVISHQPCGTYHLP